MTIVRKTYGYNKKRDDMSASQIACICGVARPHVVKTLGELAAMNVISKESGKFGTLIEINKKYRSWGSTDLVPVPSTDLVSGSTESVSPISTELVLVPNEYHVIPKQYAASTKSVQVASTKSVHTKDNLPKDNQQKNVATEKISLGDNGRWTGVQDNLWTAWGQAFPALNLDSELSKAAAWVIANPKNKKSNYARFLTNWLTRAQDNAAKFQPQRPVRAGGVVV